jgi:hypothetical protein
MGRLPMWLLVLRLLLAGFSVQVEATPALFAATLRVAGPALPGLQSSSWLTSSSRTSLAGQPEAPLVPPLVGGTPIFSSSSSNSNGSSGMSGLDAALAQLQQQLPGLIQSAVS